MVPARLHPFSVETGLAPSCLHHLTRRGRRGKPRLYGKFQNAPAPYALAVIVSSPCPFGPVSRTLNRMAKPRPTNPKTEKIHIPNPYPPGLSNPACE